MGRLIDADKLMKCIQPYLDNNDRLYELDKYGLDVMIDAQPTAYDVDKVVTELEEYAQTFRYDDEGCDNALGVYRCRDIVKRGGIE